MSQKQCAMRTSSSSEAAQTAPVEPFSIGLEIRLYRLPQVLARIPISKSSWFAGIKAGIYPSGKRLGPRATVWRSDDIDRVIERLGVSA
jgi:predicted DNA-binding transcriptional regulator AlpA